MTGFTVNDKRNVVPRWRTFDETAALGELGPSIRNLPTPLATPLPHDPLAQTKSDWEKNRTIGHAADLVGAALFLERSHEVQDAINFLQANESQTSTWVKELIEQSSSDRNRPLPLPLATSIEREAMKRVRNLRQHLRYEPKDPVTQVDLAHAYATLGLNEKASEHMVIAQQLAPDNRFVLRSASCLWLNMEEFERAHDSLVKSDATKYDPWLMSAEIAVGTDIGASPHFISRARDLIDERRFSAFHCSELTSAVATIDWMNGSVQKAKRLFGLSLKEPTENSLAQAFRVSAKEIFLDVNDERWAVPKLFEAKAQDFYLKKEWEQAVENCDLWQRDQPFSRAPGIDGSFISIEALNDFSRAKDFAEAGRVANPDDFFLLNNLVVALINLEEFDKAWAHLKQFNQSRVREAEREVANITNLATTGLFHYRTGNTPLGRRFYLDARSRAERHPQQLSRIASRATAIHAIEEAPYLRPDDHQLLDEALHLLSYHDDPACDILSSKLSNLKKTR